MRRNLGYIIALAALLISIPRYVAVFAGIDTVQATAYGMGILLAGGAAYIVDAWADASKRGMEKTWLLLLALAVNLAYEPILLTPFVLSRLWSEPLADVMSPAYAVFWSIAVTLAPVLLVFGVVYAVWWHKKPKTQTTQDVSTKPQTVDTSAQPVQTIDTSGQVPMFRYATDRIRWLHEQQPELTQAEVAERVGCAPSTVSRAWSKNGDSR